MVRRLLNGLQGIADRLMRAIKYNPLFGRARCYEWTGTVNCPDERGEQ